MEERKEESQKEPFQVNDFYLDLNDKDNKYESVSKYLLIGGLIFFILLFIIVIIMINTSDNSTKNEDKML